LNGPLEEVSSITPLSSIVNMWRSTMPVYLWPTPNIGLNSSSMRHPRLLKKYVCYSSLYADLHCNTPIHIYIPYSIYNMTHHPSTPPNIVLSLWR
jgi:hypothetical protein